MYLSKFSLYSFFKISSTNSIPILFFNNSILSKFQRFSGVLYFSNNFESKYDFRISLLLNYALGQNTEISIDKFRYFWSSFNAYYSKLCNNKNKEVDKLDYFLKQRFNRKSGLISKKVSKLLIAELDLTSSDEIIIKNAKDIIDKHNLEYDFPDLETFILVDCGYYYRNTYFHGEKFPPVISYENSSEINNLKRINDTLEKYLKIYINESFNNNA